MSKKIVETIAGDFDETGYKDLKLAYTVESSKNKTSFVFKGEVMDIGFAKYLIEFLELNFSELRKNSKS